MKRFTPVLLSLALISCGKNVAKKEEDDSVLKQNQITSRAESRIVSITNGRDIPTEVEGIFDGLSLHVETTKNEKGEEKASGIQANLDLLFVPESPQNNQSDQILELNVRSDLKNGAAKLVDGKFKDYEVIVDCKSSLNCAEPEITVNVIGGHFKDKSFKIRTDVYPIDNIVSLPLKTKDAKLARFEKYFEKNSKEIDSEKSLLVVHSVEKESHAFFEIHAITKELKEDKAKKQKAKESQTLRMTSGTNKLRGRQIYILSHGTDENEKGGRGTIEKNELRTQMNIIRDDLIEVLTPNHKIEIFIKNKSNGEKTSLENLKKKESVPAEETAE